MQQIYKLLLCGVQLHTSDLGCSAPYYGEYVVVQYKGGCGESPPKQKHNYSHYYPTGQEVTASSSSSSSSSVATSAAAKLAASLAAPLATYQKS